MRRIRASLILVAAVAIISGCGGGIQTGIQEGVQQGATEGALSVLGQLAIEEAANVKLAGAMECTAEVEADGKTPVECTGQSQDGKKASIKGSVTSTDAEKGVVKGDLTLVYDGKEIGQKKCVGVC
jgi:hypothetical protein